MGAGDESRVRIAIVGGGAAGLLAALMRARAGHDVTVLERDRLEPAPDVESAAAAAFRPSAPPIVQPHLIMPRCRALLIQRLPDVYRWLLARSASTAADRPRTSPPVSSRSPLLRPGVT